MSRRAWLGIALWAVACDGSPAIDGGTSPDARADGSTTVCAADRDCGDASLFCTQWRCRPGDPGTDARGCIDLGSPCAAGTECDEERDACGLSWCSEGRTGCMLPGDCDGDGSRNMPECAGDDCDDMDGDRFPENPEVCDAAGHDEDCDPDTFAGADGDVDGDGYVVSTCCNGDACGDDCDDGDVNANPGASEACNGIDDDCDGEVDDVFDCIAGAEEPGVNACGRAASRVCDALCEWPDGYYRAEDETTCDYCADSLGGLIAEAPFATATASADLVRGHAAGSALITCFDVTCLTDLTGRRTGAVGGAFAGTIPAPAPLTVGYGPITVRAEVRAQTTSSTPRYGWALVVYSSVPAGGWLGSATELGVRRDANGWSAEWNVNGGDVVTLRQLRAAASDPVIASRMTGHSLDGSGSASQTIEMILTPDDPLTASIDETAVRITHPCFNALLCGTESITECANASATSCGDTLSPGDEITIGAVASTGGAGSEVRFSLWEGTVSVEDACP